MTQPVQSLFAGGARMGKHVVEISLVSEVQKRLMKLIVRTFTTLLLVTSGCFTSVKSIDVKKAAHLLNETPNVFILDARTQDEYQKEHLKGAVLIPYKEVAQHLSELPSNRGTFILVYCTVGVRSSMATNTLHQNGYFNATNMKGGIEAWKKKGLPVLSFPF